MIGEKITEILEDIEILIWTMEEDDYGPIDFKYSALRSSVKIFITTVLVEMHNLQERENMPEEDRVNMAKSLGTDIKKIVKIYTGRDFPL